MITYRDVEKARASIVSHVHRTPLFHSRSLSEMTGADVFVKAENLQKTGSFKTRGAFNKMSRLTGERVVAASMGNHAQAVAYAAGRLRMKALIVMPRTVSAVKEEATRRYGAAVELFGETFQESLDYALSLKGYTFVHAFDDDLIIAGQGTAGLEILEDEKDLDAVLVPVGGGGFVAGCAVAMKEKAPKLRVLGVQAKVAESAARSFKAGRVIEAAPGRTLADGIAVGRMGEVTFPIIQRYVDDILTVEEDHIAMAILLLMERNKLVVEGAGAAPLAALMENGEVFRGKKVAVIASGGNIDFTLIDRMIYKGLLTSGRIVVFEVTAEDTPGTLKMLSGLIASHRGNIVNVIHDRLQADLPIGETRIMFVVETRTRAHFEEILHDIEAQGCAVTTRH
jgi:threonine dehydratase